MLLHIWGYQLPLMEKPLSFNEFRDKTLGLDNKKTINKSVENTLSNEELIIKIEKIRIYK